MSNCADPHQGPARTARQGVTDRKAGQDQMTCASQKPEVYGFGVARLHHAGHFPDHDARDHRDEEMKGHAAQPHDPETKDSRDPPGQAAADPDRPTCPPGMSSRHGPEATLAPFKSGQNTGEFIAGEVRPERVYEFVFRIGRLPEQEIGNPRFARGADHQIGVGQNIGVQKAGQRFSRPPLRGRSGLPPLRAPDRLVARATSSRPP